MDHLPLVVLRQILSHVRLKDRFIMMRVSRSFKAACRWLLADQQLLEIHKAHHRSCRRDDMRSQLFLRDTLSADFLSRLSLSLKRMTSLRKLKFCSHSLVFAEAVTGVLEANAAHLQKLWFTSNTVGRHARIDLRGIALPSLRVLSGCHAQDLASLAGNSPLLRDISVHEGRVSRDDMHSLARLAQTR